MVHNSNRSTNRWVTLVLAASLLLGLFVATAPESDAAPLKVAVMDSQSSKNYGNGIPPHPYSQGYDILGRENAMKTWVQNAGYDLVVFTDADLENRSTLDTVDVLILPWTVAMNQNAQMTVRKWVEDGGRLMPILAAPRFFLNDQGEWDLWIWEMNHESWEWGPISQAYQMMFLNDPVISQFDAVVEPGHPITDDALASLGVSSATFVQPNAAGAEFAYPYNDNVTSLLTYDNLIGFESQYNGLSAAQAVEYGHGRIVYWDIQAVDFLPHYNYNLSILSAGAGIDNGDLVDAMFTASIDWLTAPSTYVPVLPQGLTYGEVDVYQDAIYVRQYVEAAGDWPVLGQAIARVYRPNGSLMLEHVKPEVGVQPGGQRMYSWSFPSGGTLEDGTYRVEIVYTYTYPDYDEQNVAEAFVVRGQGTNIPTVPAQSFDVDWSGFSQILHPTGGSLGIDAPSGASWTVTIQRRGEPVFFTSPGTGDGSVFWSGSALDGPYLVTADFGALGSEQRFIQVGDYEWPFVDDEGTWARVEIEDMFERGITYGCGWSTYCPDRLLTREEVLTFIARAVADGETPWPSYQGYYTDVPPGQWYTGPIEYLVEEGVLPGGTLGQGFLVERAWVVDVVMNAVGDTNYGPYQGYFTDVTESDWFWRKIERAYELGIARGYPDGTFRPYGQLTREAGAAFLMRGL